MTIATDRFSRELRARVLRRERRELLIARLTGSLEAEDDYTRVNCDGYGRVRTYRNYTLHLATASQGARPMLRGHPPVETLRTQVFQLAACNWRCWYCFVDDDRLSANRRFSRFFSVDELIDRYLAHPDPPDVLDLSGGQPDLVPEWCLWTMQSLERRGLRGRTWVWMDDNLSTRYLWEHLRPQEVAYMAGFPRHSRVGCFKGFDERSFAATTQAEPAMFQRQFDVFADLLSAGFDMYAYATFTSEPAVSTRAEMSDFVDRLQAVHPRLPLRTVPLRVHPFQVTTGRMTSARAESLRGQHQTFALWDAELQARFSRRERDTMMDAIRLD